MKDAAFQELLTSLRQEQLAIAVTSGEDPGVDDVYGTRDALDPKHTWMATSSPLSRLRTPGNAAGPDDMAAGLADERRLRLSGAGCQTVYRGREAASRYRW